MLSSVNDLGSASPYFQSITIDAPRGAPGATTPFTNPGDLLRFLTNPATGAGDPAKALRLYNSDGIRNLASVSTNSITIAGDYTLKTEKAGTFSLSTVAAILTKITFTAVPGNPPLDLLGHSTSSGQFGGTLPKYSIRSSLDWTFQDLDITLSNSYISGTTDTGANGTTTPEIPVERYFTFDVRVGYSFQLRDDKKLKLAVGVNNIGDRMPPLAPRAFPDTRADTSTFSPIGRLFYATISAEF